MSKIGSLRMHLSFSNGTSDRISCRYWGHFSGQKVLLKCVPVRQRRARHGDDAAHHGARARHHGEQPGGGRAGAGAENGDALAVALQEVQVGFAVSDSNWRNSGKTEETVISVI